MVSKAMKILMFLALLIVLPHGAASAQAIARKDFSVESAPGISLFVREVKSGAPQGGRKTPILLVHGARVPGLASFDLPVPNGSLAADLAKSSHPVYIMDARGYGRSTRPAAMSEPPDANPPLVRSPEVVQDIAAVVDWIRKRDSVDRIALLGWATGGNWCGYYATLHPDRVSDLIFLNTLYGGSDRHSYIGHGSSLEDPEHPGRFNFAEFGAYRFSTAKSLFGAWDRSIPLEDKSKWRDPEVAAAYAKAALASDPTSQSRSPPSFRAPSGAMEDSFHQAIGHRLWDASFIRSRVLIVASERDFWSRPADRETLARDLVHAREVRAVVIPGATHHVFLDRPEHGRDRFIGEVLSFLDGK
ncbi:MAG TPA: alpha/beta fold hydrolase [Rhodanobacteraceae bacterium]|nr:alpha/beta fold hydrolase [Rhodanobacteraceae bacterium]